MVKGERAGGEEKEVKCGVEARVTESSECITSGSHTDLRRAARVDGNTAASVSGRRDRTKDHHSITSDGQTEKFFLPLFIFFPCMRQTFNILFKGNQTSHCLDT